jgi:N-methylhydantoinase B
MTVTTDRVLNTPPWGIFGGKDGKPSITKVYRTDGSVEKWRKISNLPLKDGDVVSFQTGGGGGYGSPLERDPEMVKADVINGYVSVKNAKKDYGVVFIRDEVKVDEKATLKLRKEMKQSQ